MPDSFTHLHVASGWSLKYGASAPEALVALAAEHGMGALALTDRDGAYGAVKFAKACLSAGIAPILGVDLAVAPSGALPASATPAGGRRTRRSPARGGAAVDPGHARVVVLARSGARGWAAVCRLISAAHLGGERGRPLATLDLVAEHAAGGDLLVLLGPASEVGRAVAARRPDLARAALDRWRDGVDPGQLRVEVVSHHAAADPLAAQRQADLGRVLGSGGMPALSTALAGRMLGFAAEHGVAAVLANAVRHARPDDAVTADVLDAVRRLVPLDRRHLDRRGAQAWVKPGAQMAALAEAIACAAGASTRAGA